MVVERKSRDQFAFALRRLAIGAVTNDDFEQMLPKFQDDPALREIFTLGVWRFYSDHDTQTVSLTRAERREVARWIMFLHSDAEYEWPVRRWSFDLGDMSSRLVEILSLGLFTDRRYRFGTAAYAAHGDFTVWPFIDRTSYRNALSNPRYFAKNIRR